LQRKPNLKASIEQLNNERLGGTQNPENFSPATVALYPVRRMAIKKGRGKTGGKARGKTGHLWVSALLLKRPGEIDEAVAVTNSRQRQRRITAIWGSRVKGPGPFSERK
jgi:hypothetical protein